jgi:ABC-type phosphate transport system substrate-binding protein
MNRLLGIIIITTVIFYGCNQGQVTPTVGNVTVEVDEAVFPIIKNEVIAFDSLYKQVKIELKATTPMEGMVNLLNNKSKMFVSTRYFSKKQSDFIDSQKLDVNIFKFCYNPVAIICSKNNSTDKIRVDEIKDALLGKDLHYTFVLPQNSSGTFQYIKEDILDGQDPKNAEYALNDEEVVKKIIKSSSLIGIVSFNTIQDSSKIKFIQVGQLQKTLGQGENKNINVDYVIPHPGFVLKNYYPLKQIVYVYLYDVGIGPASGFTTFLTSYEGQKIALGENLAPAAVPVKINDYH